MGKRIGRNPGSRRLASCIRRTSLPGEGRHNWFRQPSCHCRHEPCSTNQSGEPRRIRKRRIRSEEHTSELQSRGHLVCRLLLVKEKKKKKKTTTIEEDKLNNTCKQASTKTTT